MAMNRVAESYSTQNKRNEKLRWKARRDETYNKTQCVEFLSEEACLLQIAHFQLKIKMYRRLYSRDPLSLKRAISLVDITSFRLGILKASSLQQQQQQQEQAGFFASLHFRAVGKRGGRSPLRVLQISHSYLSWKTDIFSVPPGF